MRLRIGIIGELKDECKLKDKLSSKEKYSIINIDGVKSLKRRDRLEFMINAIDERREIAAHLGNDVFGEYESKFYPNNIAPWKTLLAAFKRDMKKAVDIKGHRLCIDKVDEVLRANDGIRNIWSIYYEY